MTLLRDLPFDGWLWPLLGGAVAWFVYRLGVRAGTTEIVAAEHPASDRGPELDAPSREPAHLDSLVQAALSLKNATPVEVELRRGAYAGQHVTVSGTLANVDDWVDCLSVHLELDLADTAPELVTCHCFLRFPPVLGPAVKALATGIHLRARGTIQSVKPGSISLEECELLRIGDGTSGNSGTTHAAGSSAPHSGERGSPG